MRRRLCRPERGGRACRGERPHHCSPWRQGTYWLPMRAPTPPRRHRYSRCSSQGCASSRSAGSSAPLPAAHCMPPSARSPIHSRRCRSSVQRIPVQPVARAYLKRTCTAGRAVLTAALNRITLARRSAIATRPRTWAAASRRCVPCCRCSCSPLHPARCKSFRRKASRCKAPGEVWALRVGGGYRRQERRDGRARGAVGQQEQSARGV